MYSNSVDFQWTNNFMPLLMSLLLFPFIRTAGQIKVFLEKSTISKVYYDTSQNRTVITDTSGIIIKKLKPGTEYEIRDRSNHKYLVTIDSKVIQLLMPSLKPVHNGGPLIQGGANTSLRFGDSKLVINFMPHDHQRFGFDAAYMGTAPLTDYEYISNSVPYHVAWKSVAVADSDLVTAKIGMNPTQVDPARVRFKTYEGQPLKFQYDTSRLLWVISIHGRLKHQVFSIYPYYSDQNNEILCGKLNVISLDNRKVKLVIVPLNGFNTSGLHLDKIEKYLNRIYQQANMTYNITSFTPLEVKETEDSLQEIPRNSQIYSSSEKKIIKAYESKNDKIGSYSLSFLVQPHQQQ